MKLGLTYCALEILTSCKAPPSYLNRMIRILKEYTQELTDLPPTHLQIAHRQIVMPFHFPCRVFSNFLSHCFKGRNNEQYRTLLNFPSNYFCMGFCTLGVVEERLNSYFYLGSG